MSNIPRVGSAFVYENAIRNIAERQKSLSGLQENLTSAKRVVRPSDDPVAAAQAERSLSRLERIKTEQRSLDTQRDAMTLAEATLGEANDLIQEARELIVLAGTPTFSQADRQTVAFQLKGLRDQLLAVANRKDTNGMPLLNALSSASDPFKGPASGKDDYVFDGLPGQTASGTTSVPLTVDGNAAFMFQPQKDGAYNAKVTNMPMLTTMANANMVLGEVAVTPAGQTPQGSYEVTFLDGSNYVVTNTSTGKSFPTQTLSGSNITIPDTPSVSVSVTVGAPVGGEKITFTRPQDRTLSTSTVDAAPIDPNDPAALTAIGKNYQVKIDSLYTDPSTQQTQVTYGIFDVSDPANPQVIANSPFTSGPFPPNESINLAIKEIPGIRFEVSGKLAAGDTFDLKPAGSIFSVLDSAIKGIGDSTSSNDVSQAVGQALGNLDKGLERILTVRGQAGYYMARAEQISENRLSQAALQLEADRARFEDQDMIQGVTDFQNQQTAYSAALQSYAQIQKLSLFNFIG